ncbi:hypothetical protein [Clostridium beijerinckii]|uniref:hypothetical protein n=1 Tax=Clostridium beijerinckii TaxID=1520 RepID=UPI00232C2253|nr:hypothetical protein [Clostridium beijerinckii]
MFEISLVYSKKIKWTKIGGTWSGMVYKCPRSPMEDHDLRFEDIENCEKCKYFNGYVYEYRRKMLIKCIYRIIWFI